MLRHADGIEPRQPHSGDIPIAADALIETAALDGGTLRIDDYELHEASDPHLRAQGVRAVLTTPLVAGTLDQGVLIVFRRDGPFDPGADTLLSQAAQTLALVLATHEARRAHGQALAREQLLARAANETAAAPDIEIAMRHTAEGAAGVADAVFAAVLLATARGRDSSRPPATCSAAPARASRRCRRHSAAAGRSSTSTRSA